MVDDGPGEVEMRWVPLAEAARELGCSLDTARRRIKAGTLEARKALKALAETAPEAWLKQEAQASLGRLQARP